MLWQDSKGCQGNCCVQGMLPLALFTVTLVAQRTLERLA